jgi:hypothetical protein
MEVSRQLHAPAALPPGKEPLVPFGWEAGWAPEPFWTRRFLHIDHKITYFFVVIPLTFLFFCHTWQLWPFIKSVRSVLYKVIGCLQFCYNINHLKHLNVVTYYRPPLSFPGFAGRCGGHVRWGTHPWCCECVDNRRSDISELGGVEDLTTRNVDPVDWPFLFGTTPELGDIENCVTADLADTNFWKWHPAFAFNFCTQTTNWNISLSTDTRLQAGRKGFDSRQEQYWDFFSSPPPSDRLWGPPSLLSTVYRWL